MCHYLQEKVRKLRDDWNYVKNRGEPVAAVAALAALAEVAMTPVKSVAAAAGSGE